MSSNFFLGKHLICEVYEVDPELLKDENFLRDVLLEAAKATGSTILGDFFYKFGGGEGVTGLIAIAESHLSIHTWPEHGYAAIDIFTCGSHVDPWKGLEVIKKRLRPKRVQTNEMGRGLIEEEQRIV